MLLTCLFVIECTRSDLKLKFSIILDFLNSLKMNNWHDGHVESEEVVRWIEWKGHRGHTYEPPKICRVNDLLERSRDLTPPIP